LPEAAVFEEEKMVRIPANSIGSQQVPEIQSAQPQPVQANSKTVIEPHARDSFEVAPLKTQSMRELIGLAKSENKTILTQDTLNRSIKTSLSLGQLADAGKDVKGWIHKNFVLSSGQKAQISSLKNDHIQQIQQAFTRASDLKKSLAVNIQAESNRSGGFRAEPEIELKDITEGEAIQITIAAYGCDLPALPADLAFQKALNPINIAGMNSKEKQQL
jgi:hypothetical protein